MESTLVIKVKHGETLRRINGHVTEDGQLGLDMDGLREKVCGLFNLSSAADFTLTYVDEDGDIVTLVEDEDLCDVMHQSLNPLRISVKLNEKGGRSYNRSSGTSTPLRSPRVQNSVPNLDRSVSEILKSIPEPLREAVSKISQELASKASSSVPGLAELVDCFSKMGQSHENPVSEVHAGTKSSTQIESPTSSMCPSMNKLPEALKDDMGNEGPSYKNNQKLVLEGIRVVEASITPDASFDAACDRKDEVEKIRGCDISKAGGFGCFDGKSVASNCSDSDNKKFMNAKKLWKSVGAGASTGMPVADDSALPFKHNGYGVPPFRRNYNQSIGLDSIFHKGIRCDGCGVYPITGPRFKSKVKENYDLCSTCFAEMGDTSDYIQMDRPVPYQHHCYPHKGLSDRKQNIWERPPTVPHVLRCDGMKTSRRKLDSLFFLDANIFDGTIMGPSTPFTKIWRVQNNGTMVWPQGTQLTWIGGDKLSETLSVELQISSNGLAVGSELAVAVDFTAPERPGRYSSYWRMSSPYGHKFGQRVWVLIQVDASLKDSMRARSGLTESEMINLNREPMVVEDSLCEPNNSTMAPDLIEPMVEAPPLGQEQNFPTNDTLLLGGGFSKPITPEVRTSVSYPVVDFSGATPVVPSNLPSTSFGLPTSEDEFVAVAEWDPILEKLQEMGFYNNETNKRLLKKNNGSIKRVVMDLIAAEKV